MSWFLENLSTVIVASILLVLVVLVLIKMTKDKKNGKSSCGGNCSSCRFHSDCHNEKWI